MKFPFLIVLLLTFLSVTAQAQPGGGGGLYIHRFYNQNLDYLSPSEQLIKTHFVLSDTNINPLAVRNIHPNYLFSFPRYYAYKIESFHRESVDFRQVKESHHRILIVFEGDSMIIDFLNIMPENPAGIFSTMDSICFQPIYMKVNLDEEKIKRHNYIQVDSIQKYLRRGITPNTIPMLSKFGIIEEIKIKDDNHFKDLLMLSKTIQYHIEEAFYCIRNDKVQQALDLFAKLNLKHYDKKVKASIIFGKYSAYKRMNQLDSAEFYLKQYIEVVKDYKHLVTLAELQVRLGLNLKALDTYEQLVSRSKSLKDSINNFHKLFSFCYETIHDDNYLENYCQKLLRLLPKNHMQNKFGGDSEFFLLFYDYARLNLKLGIVELFEKFMALAIEFGFKHANRVDELQAFHLMNNLIIENPKHKYYRLLRANLYLKTMDYQGNSSNGSTSWNIDQMQSVEEDLTFFEKKREKSATYYYCLAQYNYRNKAFKKALSAINQCIQLKPEYPQLYMLKYRIKKGLDTAIMPYQEDPDMIIYHEMKSNWQFHKYASNPL